MSIGNADSDANSYSHTDGYSNTYSYGDTYTYSYGDTYTHRYAYCDPDSYTYGNADRDSYSYPYTDANRDGYAHRYAGPDHTRRARLQSAGFANGGPLMDRGDFEQHRRLPKRRVDGNRPEQRFLHGSPQWPRPCYLYL
jgi:hypothetical protein